MRKTFGNWKKGNHGFFAANHLYLPVFANEDGKEKKKNNVTVIGSGSHANQILPKDLTAAQFCFLGMNFVSWEF